MMNNSLDTSNWKEFKVKDIFRLVPTKGIISTDLESGTEVPYIAAKKRNNGLEKICKLSGFEDWVSEGNCIVFVQIGEGSTGYVDYIDTDFIGMNGKTCCGYIDGILNKYIGMFLTTILSMNKPKYSFGRSWTGNRLKNTIMKLPATQDGKPDWKFMEEYIKSIWPNIGNSKVKKQLVEFDCTSWKEFLFTDIFVIKKGFYNKKPEHILDGNFPFLGATECNNGVTEYYSLDDIEFASKTGKGKNESLTKKIFSKNAVCVTNNGSVGFAYFQDKNFTCSHDVNPLYRKDGEFNKFTGLFVASVIMKDRYRWCYGRKWRPERMIHSTIKLPATSEGKPDWKYMESFMKRLVFSDMI